MQDGMKINTKNNPLAHDRVILVRGDSERVGQRPYPNDYAFKKDQFLAQCSSSVSGQWSIIISVNGTKLGAGARDWRNSFDLIQQLPAGRVSTILHSLYC